MPGGTAGESPRLPKTSTTDVGDSRPEQASAAPGVRHHRSGKRAAYPAVSDAADPVELNTNAIARLLETDRREDLLVIMREILTRTTFAERLAYSPDETAELLGISRELVHDLLRTGQLGSVKAGRRRLIAKHHLEAFLAGEP